MTERAEGNTVHQKIVSFHPGQLAIYNSPARFKVCAAGRRFGKSHYGAWTLGIEAMRTESRLGHRLTQEHGVYYIAPTFAQASRVMWPKLRELLGYANRGGLIVRENINDGWLEVVSGRRIHIKGADNPDSLRGIALSYVVLDEYADMKDTVWSEIIEPALMDVEGDALFIGTPKGKNHFYKLFTDAAAYVWDKSIDAVPLYEAFHFSSKDNPYLKEKELARMMKANAHRTQDIIRQELEASFIATGARILKPSDFRIIDVAPDFYEGSIVITVDLAGFKKESGNKILRTDDSVICKTLVTADGWFVLDMECGKWDARETALRIVRACANYPGCMLGIEKGALMNAVGPYMEDYMRQFNRYVTPRPLTHGNQKKQDRILWSLQGRAERGRIALMRGPWNEKFLEQVGDFPDPLCHDDMVDALAYVDQMATAVYLDDSDIPEWEPLDLDSGY